MNRFFLSLREKLTKADLIANHFAELKLPALTSHDSTKSRLKISIDDKSKLRHRIDAKSVNNRDLYIFDKPKNIKYCAC